MNSHSPEPRGASPASWPSAGVLLGIDVGSTHCKAGVFARDGSLVAAASRPMQRRLSSKGYVYFDPEELWQAVTGVVSEAVQRSGAGEAVAAVGVASMAETGLLLDRRTGASLSPLIPWFDTNAAPQAERMRQAAYVQERFLLSGIRPTFKCSLAKLLWLRDAGWEPKADDLWLSAADYIAYRLTGAFGTDASLAGRTFAFRIGDREWDAEWLARWELPEGIFPRVVPFGEPVGRVQADAARQTGLELNLPVSIAGHDHVCAAFAAGVTAPGRVFDSMGTAETLLGALADRPLTKEDFRSGLAFGCHVVPDRLYWLGGVSASGGSVEWLRACLNDPALTYAELDELVQPVALEPTGILYFPYLLGSGSPHSDPAVRAAFVGLTASHSRAHLVKAVLEGTAYEVEFIRRAGEQATGVPIAEVHAAGGGTRNRTWMQVKADVSGVPFAALPVAEATLLGAALLSGVSAGVYPDAEAATDAVRGAGERGARGWFYPDTQRHTQYQRLYEQGYLPFQEPLVQYSHLISQAGNDQAGQSPLEANQ